MGLTYLQSKLSVALTLIQPPPPPTGLGPPLLLMDRATGAVTEADFQLASYASAAEVDTAETAGALGAADAVHLKAMLAQIARPDRVWVAAYDSTAAPTPETVADAMDRVVESEALPGAWVTTTVKTDSVLGALAAWVAVDGRDLLWCPVLQSAEADLLTAGKPSGLSALEQRGIILEAHDDDGEPQAAALAGALSGRLLTRGSVGSEFYLRSVALPDFRTPQKDFALANDCGVLMPLGRAATANQRARRGIKTYGAIDIAAWTSARWVHANVVDALTAFLAGKLEKGDPVLNNPDGCGEISAAVEARLAQVAQQGAPSARHLTPGSYPVGADTVRLPAGYRVSIEPSGENVAVQVDFLVAGQVERVIVALDGVVTQ